MATIQLFLFVLTSAYLLYQQTLQHHPSFVWMLYQGRLIFDRVQLISRTFQIGMQISKENQCTSRVSLTTPLAESAFPRNWFILALTSSFLAIPSGALPAASPTK